jgi:hypothetical protein
MATSVGNPQTKGERVSRRNDASIGRTLFEALQAQATATERGLVGMERQRTDPKYPAIAIEIEKARANLRRLRSWARWVGKRM